jgi:membrane-associated phospholipid phosphatase
VPPHWRPLAYGAALLFGSAVGLMRMTAGAHFFSDVVFAGVIAFVVIWLTHGWLYRWRTTRVTDDAVETAFERAARPTGSIHTSSTLT